MITLICGIPRSGKTTYSERYQNVIHLDEEHYYTKVLAKVRKSSGDIVVEGIYDRAAKRRELIEAYIGMGAKCIWIDTPADVITERTGRAPRQIEFEQPTKAEGWDEIVRL